MGTPIDGFGDWCSTMERIPYPKEGVCHMIEAVNRNRAFDEMEKAILPKLRDRKPEDISDNTGFVYDSEKQQFHITTLANEFTVDYPSFQFSLELEGWYHLLVLHYMSQADGTMPTEELISLGSLKDGLIRGTKFDRDMEQTLSARFKGKTEEEIWSMFEKLDGKRKEGKGDLCIEIPFFPRYPVIFNVWLEDEEFPVSVKMLVDKSADHYLTIEDAVTLGEVLLNQLQL